MNHTLTAHYRLQACILHPYHTIIHSQHITDYRPVSYTHITQSYTHSTLQTTGLYPTPISHNHTLTAHYRLQACILHPYHTIIHSQHITDYRPVSYIHITQSYTHSTLQTTGLYPTSISHNHTLTAHYRLQACILHPYHTIIHSQHITDYRPVSYIHITQSYTHSTLQTTGLYPTSISHNHTLTAHYRLQACILHPYHTA